MSIFASFQDALKPVEDAFTAIEQDVHGLFQPGGLTEQAIMKFALDVEAGIEVDLQQVPPILQAVAGGIAQVEPTLQADLAVAQGVAVLVPAAAPFVNDIVVVSNALQAFSTAYSAGTNTTPQAAASGVGLLGQAASALANFYSSAKAAVAKPSAPPNTPSVVGATENGQATA